MVIYIVVLIFVYLTSLSNSKQMNKLDIVFFIFLTVVSGFRYGVGTDYFNYVNSFELISLGYTKDYEPGFLLMNIIISKLNLNSQVIFLITSVLTMLFFYKGIKYYLKNDYTYKPILYVIFLIFTYFNSFNGVRQFLAAAILFYASRYIIEKNILKFSMWVLFAMQFHFSSIIFLGLYFIATRNFKKNSLLITLFISGIVSNLGLIRKIFEYILTNLSFLDIGGYITHYIYSSYNMREVRYGIVFFINVIILLVLILTKNRMIKNDKDLLCFNLFYIYVLCGVLSMGAPMLTRLTYYFTIYMAIYIPKFGVLFNENSKRIVDYTISVLYLLLFLYIITNGYLNLGQADFIPYNYKLNLIN